jgi:hypothetical protein
MLPTKWASGRLPAQDQADSKRGSTVNSKNFSLRLVAVAALLGLSGVAQAALTVYTDEASFMAAVINAGTDDFSTLVAGDLGVSISRSTLTNGYTYDASAPLNVYGIAGTPNWLSLASAGDTLTIANFGGGVMAVGGNFFNTDEPGTVFGGNVTVTGSDGGTPVSTVISNATTGSFVGFVSTGLMTSLTMVADNSANGVPDFSYPTVGRLMLASAVPEPETYALMLAGLGLVGFLARRRRA